MLSIQENERLSRVGPGTPMGELMRRYWHPIAAVGELDERPTKAMRVLGEDLVLYKDKSGTIGLIERFCPHRRVDLSYGIPEEHGLRCMYHGWMMDETGQCIEQPFEETVHPDGRFKEKVKVAAYPVQVLRGMIFAYMGPSPVPLLPMWEPFTWDDIWCEVALAPLPCNWLQCQENSLDPVHLEWLHGYWGVRQQHDKAVRLGLAKAEEFGVIPRPHQKIGFDMFEYGVIKRRVVEGTTEDDADWAIGHPVMFPQILFVGSTVRGSLQYRTPIDDENCLHITWFFLRTAPGQPVVPQEQIPYYHVPLYGEDGRLIEDLVNHQDFVAWITQGVIPPRHREHLGESDRGVIFYRKLLMEQMDIVADGGEPMGVVRDPEVNKCIDLPLEKWPALSNPARMAQYAPSQAGQSREHIERLEEFLRPWADAPPWQEAAVS